MNEPQISGHCVHNWLSLATPCPECVEARQGTLEIPEHIRKAAATVEIFFKVNGIDEWALMGIQSRRSEPEPVHNSDGMINKLAMELVGELQMIPADESYEKCKEYLRKAATTERAARDRADLMATECIERITKVAYAAESELAALKAELGQALLPRLAEVQNIYCQSERKELRDENAALKLKMGVVKVEFGRIITHASHLCHCKSIAQEALSQLNESEEKK